MLFRTPELSEQFLSVVARIGELRDRLRYQTSDARRRWTGFLRRSTFARGIQGSNSIEGYNVTVQDAVAAVDGEEPLTADAETWSAIVGYREAMSYVCQLADDPYFAHNVGTIRGLHYMMIAYDLSKHPGRWRPGAVWVRNEGTGETVYTGPDVEFVPPLMDELVASLNERNEMPPMVRAAMAHLNLVMIHPFSDGNGRMGRALQSMILSREGIVDPTFSSIEEYLGKNTLEYYAVLGELGQGAWNPQRDALPWIKFCLTAHYRQATTLLRRIREIERVWNAIEAEAVGQRRYNERVVHALMDAAFGYRVKNSSYRKQVEISDAVAGSDLRDLTHDGLLLPRGERRGRYYVAGNWLEEVRGRARERAENPDPFAAALERPGQGTSQAELALSTQSRRA
jgi:Fic family protein